jgi:hypothetical protein
MPQEIDVYHLLKTFAARNKMYVMQYVAFSQAIQRQAKSYDQSIPLYRDLVLHPDSILIPRLFQLARDKRISLQAVENRIDLVMLPEAFTEVLYAEYRRMEENPDIPFPDETALKLSIPPEWIQAVSVESDLPALLGVEGDRPVPMYRLLFPEGLKSIVVLSEGLGEKLLEYAGLKIRNYLRKGSNKDFIQQRLASAFSGKDRQLKDSMTAVLIRPFDALGEMRQGSGDFSYSFWAYLTSAIRKDLSGKGDPGPDDLAAYQASYIIDVFNNHYKGKAQLEQERETAFKTLSLMLHKPPYLFAVEDIADFRDSQGRPLLGKYTREELEQWLRARTTEAAEGALPELLLFSTGQVKGKLIAKETLLPYLFKALREARAVIKPLITYDWHKILADFRSIPAMDDDLAFRKELDSRLAAQAPLVTGILMTDLPALVYQEFRGVKDAPAELDRCFGGGKTAGSDVLLELERKSLLTDVRVLLPFWYAVPFLSWIVSLFVRGARRRSVRKGRAVMEPRLDASDGGANRPANARAAEFSQMARIAEKKMLPPGLSLEEHLSSLVLRWNTLLDPVAKANLTEDINSLVRDFMRASLRSMRPSSFTPERIETMASTLADRPNLLRIRNHTALESYIQLYIIKLLKR